MFSGRPTVESRCIFIIAALKRENTIYSVVPLSFLFFFLFGCLFVVKEYKYFVSVNVTIAVLIKNHYRFASICKKNRPSCCFCFLCELQKQRQVLVRARVRRGMCAQQREARQMRGMERERDAKIHTPKDVKLPSRFILVRRVRRAQREEGESEAKAPTPEGESSHAHTHTLTHACTTRYQLTC